MKGRAKTLLFCMLGTFIFLLWSERKIFINSTGFGNRMLEVIYTLCMLISITSVIYYLLIDLNPENYGKYFKGYALLLVVQTIAFLPMYTQNFMYGDDLWGFQADNNGIIYRGIFFSRPFASFLRGPMIQDNFHFIKNFRIYNGIILCLFACILFKYIFDFTGKYLSAFCYSAIAACSVIAVDCIAYASIYPINASLLFSAISFILYLRAREAQHYKKLLYVIFAGIGLFSAFNMYQLGTPIVFLMYVISNKYDKNSGNIIRFRKALCYLFFYGITAIVYLFFTKGIQILTGITAGQSARSQFVFDIMGIRQKLLWFIQEVCPQTMHKMVAIILGNSLFKQNNMFYQCTYESENLRTIWNIVLLGILAVSIITLVYKQHSISTALIIFAAVPLSFWPFLILPESLYLTYYAICLILFWAWLTGNGVIFLYNILGKKWGKKKKIVDKILAFFFVAVIVLQSNNYAENTWVNYCRDSYELLANTICAGLANTDKIDTIQVRGNIGPYVGGRDYVVFCVENILNEMGYSPGEFKIRQLDSEYYLSLFNDGEIDHMKEVLGSDRVERLLEFYIHDEMYSRWLYNGKATDIETLLFLQQCFIETEQIVIDDEHTILINLTGFNYRNAF